MHRCIHNIHIVTQQASMGNNKKAPIHNFFTINPSDGHWDKHLVNANSMKQRVLNRLKLHSSFAPVTIAVDGWTNIRHDKVTNVIPLCAESAAEPEEKLQQNESGESEANEPVSPVDAFKAL